MRLRPEAERRASAPSRATARRSSSVSELPSRDVVGKSPPPGGNRSTQGLTLYSLGKGAQPRMRNIIVVGGQWGDEGKGKVVDLLADRFDIVVRWQGGPNAGH